MTRPATLSIFGQLAAALLLLSTAAVRGEDRPLASAAVNYSIYREGTVQRVEHQFGAWLMTCDEIKSLARKFCSLRSVARAADGTIIASLVVSTDDSGRPTGLVTLPFGTVLGSGALVLKEGTKQAASRLELRPALCDGMGCEVVWSLSADDIRTLSRGEPLRMSFAMVSRDSRPMLFDPAPARTSVVGALQTAGFADALQASLK